MMITIGTEGVQVPTGDAEVRPHMDGGATGAGAGAGATVPAGGTTAPGDTESSINLCCPHSLMYSHFVVCINETPFWL